MFLGGFNGPLTSEAQSNNLVKILKAIAGSSSALLSMKNLQRARKGPILPLLVPSVYLHA